jgi:hypothetical protein
MVPLRCLPLNGGREVALENRLHSLPQRLIDFHHDERCYQGSSARIALLVILLT